MRNPLLGLFGSNCNRLDYNDDLVIGSDVYPDARLDIEVPEDGVFILAAAASPDTEFDGSSDATGNYTLRIDLSPWATPLEPPRTTVERAAGGRIDVHILSAGASEYNVYRDGRYVTTVRLPRRRNHFRLDGIAGSYCIVAFGEHERRDRYSDWRFDACEHQGLRHDGAFLLHDSARGERYESAGMSIALNDDIATTFSGTAQWFRSQTAFFDDIGSWDTDGFALNARTLDGDLEISDSTSHFSYGYQYGGAFRARMAGSLAVRSDKTEERLLHASTPVEFRYERGPDESDDPGTAWNFTNGQLELIADDGSSVLFDADTGNARTVRVTIDNERGPDIFVTNWRQWQAQLRFDRYPEDAP